MTQTNDPQIGGQAADNSPMVSNRIPRVRQIPMPSKREGHAFVIVTTHVLALDRRYYTFEWDGKPWWPTRIYNPRFGEPQISDLPWKLRLVERSVFMDAGVYVREDGWLLPLAMLTDLRYSIKRRMLWIYMRLIMTLVVWELADVPLGEVPSWRHIGKRRTL